MRVEARDIFVRCKSSTNVSGDAGEAKSVWRRINHSRDMGVLRLGRLLVLAELYV